MAWLLALAVGLSGLLTVRVDGLLRTGLTPPWLRPIDRSAELRGLLDAQWERTRQALQRKYGIQPRVPPRLRLGF